MPFQLPQHLINLPLHFLIDLLRPHHKLFPILQMVQQLPPHILVHLCERRLRIELYPLLCLFELDVGEFATGEGCQVVDELDDRELGVLEVVHVYDWVEGYLVD